MPATLQTIRGKIVELPIYLGDKETPEAQRDADDFFTLWYRQHGITGAALEMARKAEEGGKAHAAIIELCVAAFVKWDLRPGATEEQMIRLNEMVESGDAVGVELVQEEIREFCADQKPVEISVDSLMENVPLDVLILIFEQINESRYPNSNGTAKQSRKR